MPAEPIAIIGIGCRFPGSSDSPEAFWDTLCKGKDTVKVLPKERFNLNNYFHPKQGMEGKSYSKWGALVDDFDGFDASFFGISPREADFIDPQQRLLLETSWRALEDGGEVFDFKQGRQVGVFTGVSTFDYHLMQSGLDTSSKTDIYSATGSVHSIAANRISYVFNFRGPSVAVDTACSSALVAVHVACESLRQGDCEVALAGGVNSILGPVPYLAFCKMGMLSPTGRCRPFDSRADGFVRGEGAGMVLLKPLSKALKDGNRIYATIASTSSNQDGRTNGITVPNPASQEALTRDALHRAGIAPSQIAYMEAHGTGTPIGDPIEAHALGMALGDGRRSDQPCAMGSVKGNIGHLEAGAGAAGLIKAALSLYHRRIPPTLHYKNVNPNIDLERLKLRVVTEEEELPNGKSLPYVGVNSFGFGGANAHAILQAVPAAKPKPRAVRPKKSESANGLCGLALPLSGGAPESVHEIAGQFRELLDGSSPKQTEEVCLSAATERVHFLHRAVATGRNRKELLENLDLLAKGESAPDVVEGNPMEGESRQPVFVFSGQGPQWFGMGRDLLRHEPVFRDVIERCDAIMSRWGDWSLLEELGRTEKQSRINETVIAQPAIFAIQAGLSALWQSWGVKPAATVGHSVGEVAAAHAAGVLSLEEACRVIYWRGACMEATPHRGRMLAASLSEEEAIAAIADARGKVHVAAINGPKSVTLSGDSEPLELIAEALAEKQVFHRFLKVGYAFHSHHMTPARAPLLEKLGEVTRSKSTIPVYSTVSGGLATASTFNARYWWRNVRESVRFAGAIEGLIDDGQRLFLEIGPHPVLSASIGECFEKAGKHGAVVHSLERQTEERQAMLRAVGRMHVLDAEVDWQALYPKVSGGAVLPTMPFRRVKHWAEPVGYREKRVDDAPHPLLAQRLRSAAPAWSTRLDLGFYSFLRDHVIQDHPVFPAAGYLETAMGAAKQVHGDVPMRIENVDFIKAMFLPDNAPEPSIMQFRYEPDEASFEVSSRPEDSDDDWTIHVKGQFRPDPSEPSEERFDAERLMKRADRVMPGELIYRTCDFVGLHYGPRFRGLKAIYYRPLDVIAEIQIPSDVTRWASKVSMPPELLDCCFQALTTAAPDDFSLIRETGFMPVYCELFRVFRPPVGDKFYCRIRLTHVGGKMMRGDLFLQDAEGELVAEVRGLETQAVVRTKEFRATSAEECLYENAWVEAPLVQAETADSSLLQAPEWPTFDKQASARLRRLNQTLDRAAKHYLAGAIESGSRVSAGMRKRIDEWGLKLPKRIETPEQIFGGILSIFPEAYPEVLLLDRLGRGLPAVLSGRESPGSVLFPEGYPSIEEHLRQDAPSARFDHRNLRDALRGVLADLTDGSRLSVLVLGGGTGGAVSELLAEFDPERTDVVYAEADEKRAMLAEQKFFDHTFVTFETAGLATKSGGSVFAPQRFDLAIVLGGESSLISEEKAAKRLLRSLKSKALCLFEATVAPPLWSRLLFGLEDSLESEFLPMLEVSPDSVMEKISQAGLGEVSTNRPFESGRVFASARGPEKRPLVKSTPMSLEGLRHRPPVVRVIFADQGGALNPVLSKLSEHIKERVIRVDRGERFSCPDDSSYVLRPGHIADTARLFRELDRRFSLSRIEVVFGWSLDLPLEISEASLKDAESLTTAPLLAIARALRPDLEELPQSLTLVTRSAQVLTEGDPAVNPAGALMIGAGRSMISENPRMRVRLVDLGKQGNRSESDNILAEIQSGRTEDEVAWRRRGRFSLQFTPKELARGKVPASSGHRLDVLQPGMLDSLTFVESPRRKPKDGQVEISIQAAALNFRDVMKALGIYPSDSAIDMLIGDECAGVIERVGPNVKGWKVGDRVISLGAGCFGSHLTVPAPLLLPIPDAMTFEEACTLPVAFMTAVHALCGIASLKAGETVLVQAGSGGVGLAAIQLAKLLGAKVMATAGNPEKRAFLRGLGVEHVFDSRSLAFADDVLEASGGRGVDVVLNSLAGQAIEKGLSCLAPYGRFVEIGKRDIYGNTLIGLRPLRHNITLSVVDLGQAMGDGGERLRGLLGEVAGHFQTGGLTPLPHRVFPMDRALDAFRCMAQARHIGKIVLSAAGSRVTPRRLPREKKRLFDPKGTYVVTGGLSGFGREMGSWMVAHGARRVYLVSRSGHAGEMLEDVIRQASKQGVEILTAAVDVTSRDDVDQLFKKIRKSKFPLKGIVHSAMVLDDKTLSRMKPEQMSRVLAPKVVGTWNLHEASLVDDLDHFIMFSSVSSLLGNAGQGNYSAANAFLDSMAHYRKSRGLAALTVNWGQLGDVGVAAADDKLKDSLTRQGIIPLPPDRAKELLGKLIPNRHTQTGLIPIDWKQFRKTHPQLEKSSRYAEVFSRISGESSDSGSRSAREILMEAPPNARRRVLDEMLKEEVAKVLRTSTSKIRDDRPLTQLGLDSLMTFELLMRLESQFEISVPPAKMREGTTLADVSAHLLELISGKSGGDDSSSRSGPSATENVGEEAKLDLPDRCLVDLKKTGSKEPLFMIHPAGGLVGIYDGLASRVPEDRPVVALQSRVFFADGGEFQDFEAMVEAYATSIAKRQPRGDLHLFGFSFGAWMAHSIAAHFELKGRRVAWLGLVDPMEVIPTMPEHKNDELFRWHIEDIFVLLGELLGEEIAGDTAMLDELEKIVPDLGSLSPKASQARIQRWLNLRPELARSIDPRLIDFALNVHLKHAMLGRSAALNPVAAPVRVWRGNHQWSGSVEGRPLGMSSLEESVHDLGHFEFFHDESLLSLAADVAKSLDRP